MRHEDFEVDDESVPAAPVAADPGAAPEAGDGDEALTGDGGFSDTDRAVRVWLDEGRLVKVRVSPVWFTRIGQQDTLANHFREALILAALDRAEREREAPCAEPVGPMGELAALPDEVRAVFESIGELSLELLTAIDAVHDELSARVDAAIREDAERPPRTFVGRSQGVRVTMDQAGNTSAVDFDERWLDQAQVGAIATHVQLAADRATDAFVPEEPQERLNEVFEEQRLLSSVLTAILNPRCDG